MKIYCDLDGVLVDFNKGYLELTGKDISNNFINDPSFWEPINEEGIMFWVRLGWMEDGHILWDYIKKYNPIILSAPSQDPSSRYGKKYWVRQNISKSTQLILADAKTKPLYSGLDKILIDDREDTIKKCNKNKGIGILHKSASKTIKKLKELGL